MAVITGDPNERKLTFWQKTTFPEVFKGMWFTFKHIFRKPVTLEYPEKKVVLGPEFRGRPVLVAEQGKERCVACGLCARVCPPLAISMQAGETEDVKERYPVTFEIDMLRCIYCGLCEEVCPEEAIVMSPEYDMNFHARQEAIMDKPKLLIEKQALKPRLDWLQSFRNKNYGKVYHFKKSNNIHSVRDRSLLTAGSQH
jgi:NADH-quinone oxidoreductase subunit I